MANVTFLDGIMSIRGKIGDTIYRTTPSGKTIAYQQRNPRTSPPTENELRQRKRFAIATQIARVVLCHPEMQTVLMQIYKQINIKKRPATLRGYIVSQLMNMLKEMDI